MTLTNRRHTTTIAVLLLTSMSTIHAQSTDAAGHYEGAISSPAGHLPLQIDLTKTAQGEMVGTLTIPVQKLKGFPLANVMVKGKDVSFEIATSGGGYFRGELEGNGISGDFSTPMGPFPLLLERAGEARTYPPPQNAPIGKELEGAWNGTLEVDGGMRVTVHLANHPDGTSSGNLVSVDENDLTVPVVILQEGTKLTLTCPMIGSSYEGVVNASGTRLSGTYTTSRGLALPLSLTRSASN
jgi:hypothetical protein